MAKMREVKKERVYTDQEVEAKLKDEVPKWYLEDGWIRRKYKTSGWKGTLMVINTVGHLAEAGFHHPDITASYAFVIVKLKNHAAKGITDKDFALAEKIESDVMWQPVARREAHWRGRPTIRVSNTSNMISVAALLCTTGRTLVFFLACPCARRAA